MTTKTTKARKFQFDPVCKCYRIFASDPSGTARIVARVEAENSQDAIERAARMLGISACRLIAESC